MTRQLAMLHILALIRLHEVEARTGLRRSTIYERMALGTFPQQIALGGRSVAWVADEVDDWVKNQIKAARALAPVPSPPAGEVTASIVPKASAGADA